MKNVCKRIDCQSAGMVAMLVIAALLAMTVGPRGATAGVVTWTGANGNWSDTTWSTGSEPTANDDAKIGNGGTVSITQSGEKAKILILEAGSTVSQTGGDLSLHTTWTSGGLPGNGYSVIRGGASYLLQQGSLLNVLSGKDGKLFVEDGSFIQTGGTFMGSNPAVSKLDDVYVGCGDSGSGLLRIEGGGFYALHDNATLGIGTSDSGGTGRLEVSGSSIAAIWVGNGLSAGANGTLRFELDAYGVAPISIVDTIPSYPAKVDLDSEAGASRLEISLLDYAPQSDIELIDFQAATTTAVEGNFAGLLEGAEVQATYADTTYFWNITYAGDDGNDVVLQFSHVIPEPSTFTLALLALLPLAARRWRGE